MIASHWTDLSDLLMLDGGYDRLIEFLENELAIARVDRADFLTRERIAQQSPEPDGNRMGAAQWIGKDDK